MKKLEFWESHNNMCQTRLYLAKYIPPCLPSQLVFLLTEPLCIAIQAE
jgi:hypothetical protein